MKVIISMALILFLFSCVNKESPDKQTVFSANSTDSFDSTGEVSSCEPQIDDSALTQAGHADDNTAWLSSGQRIKPVGITVPVDGWSFGIAINNEKKIAYLTTNRHSGASVQVVDLETQKTVQKQGGINTYRGIEYLPKLHYLFVSGGKSAIIYRFTINEDGLIEKDSQKELFVGGFVADVKFDVNRNVIYAMANTSSEIYVIDPETMAIKKTYKAGTYPYDMELAGSDLLAVSNISTSTVKFINLNTSETVAYVKVGKNPENLFYLKQTGKLYVSASDENFISVIDINNMLAEDPIFVTLESEPDAPGITPQGITVDADNMLLFVNIAKKNETRIIDLTSNKIIGRIPTGWYPTENAFSSKNNTLLIMGSKGFGPSQKGDSTFGALLSIIKSSQYLDSDNMKQWSGIAQENNSVQEKYFKSLCGEPNTLFPGMENPIKHVVLIVRENKTYDMDLGDFKRGNGDPELTLYGEKITPNFHELALQFSNLDNFYSNPEVSLQGHIWTTDSTCNDFVNKARFNQLPVAGYEPPSLPAGGSIFDNCYNNKVSFRNYGEFAEFGPYMFNKYKDYIDVKYPFFNMDILDVVKADEVIRELNLGIFKQFTYIGLPNDHSFGTKPGKPIPQFMVADNDRATGMLVEAYSNLEEWKNTIIFIIEDDPQGTGDHVNAHRSLCVVVSPWVKRVYTSSVHYSIPNLYKTIELLLNLPPMSINDAEAIPMYDLFTTEPDFSPFKSLPQNVKLKLNTEKSPMAAESDKIDFSEPDNAQGLGKILWKAIKGDIPIPPQAKIMDE